MTISTCSVFLCKVRLTLRMRRAVHVARMENVRTCTNFQSENLKRIEHLGDLIVDQRLILDWILKICSLKAWIESSYSG
jgi:hypothetical protein